ncbi:MAG TPA: hypothetical protein VNB24_05860 [Acidimicrobiales bacterium]|nr:hypothetical protein [Acidimicrobiales bacterium]
MRWPWQRTRHTEMFFVGGNPWERPTSATVKLVSAAVDEISEDRPSELTETFAPTQAAPGTELATPVRESAVEPAPLRDRREIPADPGVRLGFADGSVLMLPDDDPTAEALRETAARLTAAVDPHGSQRT